MDTVPKQTALSICNSFKGEKGAGIRLNEIYLDGRLKKAEFIDEDEKSYGIFMHSLILSNYAEVIQVNNKTAIIGNEYEKAIYRYTEDKGFKKSFIESIAPKVDELSFDGDNNLRTSTHIINERMRIVSKGTPDDLLKRCSFILLDSKFVKITRRICREVNEVLKDMLNRSLYIYAIAIKDTSKGQKPISIDTYVNDMALVALIGMGRA